jgi:hypothetical protein
LLAVPPADDERVLLTTIVHDGQRHEGGLYRTTVSC